MSRYSGQKIEINKKNHFQPMKKAGSEQLKESKSILYWYTGVRCVHNLSHLGMFDQFELFVI